MPETIPATQGDILKVEQKVEHIAKSLEEVHNALIGNHISGDGGIVRRLFKCEEDLEDIQGTIQGILNNNIKSGIYLKWLWAAGGGLLMALISIFSSKIFGK